MVAGFDAFSPPPLHRDVRANTVFCNVISARAAHLNA
jgi:hypothetical protein